MTVIHSSHLFYQRQTRCPDDAVLSLMAPALARDLTRRDGGTGKTFSIVFALIAFLVVAACILWGYYIPRWRRKYGRPSSTRFNCTGGAAKYGPSTPPRAPRYVPHFPNHPGVRGLHKVSSLPTYNPRTETPFSNSPQNGEIINLRSLTPTPKPPAQRKKSSTLKRPTHDYELPKTPSTLSQLALTASIHNVSLDGDGDFKHTEHVEHPVARSAGRAPPLTNQLALFPTPRLNSVKRFDTLAHPNLLFEEFDKLDSQTVPQASDESCFSRPTLVPRRKRHGDNRQKIFIQTVEDVNSEAGAISEAGAVIRTSAKRSQPENIIQPIIAVPKATHEPKPKTPIASIRDRYCRYAGGIKFIPPKNASLQRHLTPSTEPLTASASVESDLVALATPPTSPPHNANDRALVPTPLRVRRTTARDVSASPTPVQVSRKHFSPSESSMALSPRKLAPSSLQQSLTSKRDMRKSIGFYHPKSTFGAIVNKPKPCHTKRMSWRGSSVYSRDTKYMSVLRSPTFAPAISSKSGKTSAPEEPCRRRANSMDLVRSKIDDWDLHTGDLQLPIAPILDRPQSDVGPRSPLLRVDTDHPAPLALHPPDDASTVLGLTMPIPKIFVGRPSDDVFGDVDSVQSSDRVLRRVLDMEKASTGSTVSKYRGKTAPGGAEWI